MSWLGESAIFLAAAVLAARLWSLRKAVVGLGGAQMIITALVISVASYFIAGQSLQTAFVIWAGLSLSSTALAIQTLLEKRQMTTRHGRAAFSLLLFQDLAAIPIIALVPLLAPHRRGRDMAPYLYFRN